MSNFPKLIPAFTVKIHLGDVSPIGVLAQGVSQVHASFIPGSGVLVSEPSYPLKVDAVFLHGSDYLRFDPDGGHARLEVSSALRDNASGAVIRFDYSGTVDTSDASGKVLKNLEGAATTDYGEIFTHVKLETGHEALKELQNKVYVGSGRFILEDGKPVIVEYKISEVAL